WPDALHSIALYQLFGISQVPGSCFERDCGLLGNRLAEYSGFLAICSQPASTDYRSGAGPADDHDPLFPCRSAGDFGDSSNLRIGDLGPGAALEPVSFEAGSSCVTDCDSAGHFECEHW